MTSSILTPHSGELNGHDLQVLKDFALEAPWEWRKAFEQLITVYENSEREYGELEAESIALESAVDDLLKEVRMELAAHKTKFPPGVEQSLNESLDALEAVRKDPVPAKKPGLHRGHPGAETVTDPIAKCRCGRCFTPMEWAELVTSDYMGGFHRKCSCGLLVRLGTAPVSYNDVKKAYEKALEEE